MGTVFEKIVKLGKITKRHVKVKSYESYFEAKSLVEKTHKQCKL